jgi:hypothetical protein
MPHQSTGSIACGDVFLPFTAVSNIAVPVGLIPEPQNRRSALEAIIAYGEPMLHEIRRVQSSRVVTCGMRLSAQPPAM